MKITTETLSPSWIDAGSGISSLTRRNLHSNAKEVQFIGHGLTKESLKPDPAKLRAILSMKKPDDVTAVQS